MPSPVAAMVVRNRWAPQAVEGSPATASWSSRWRTQRERGSTISACAVDDRMPPMTGPTMLDGSSLMSKAKRGLARPDCLEARRNGGLQHLR